MSQLKFVIEAMQQIAECRRILKWTYGYGFYNMVGPGALSCVHNCAHNTRNQPPPIAAVHTVAHTHME